MFSFVSSFLFRSLKDQTFVSCNIEEAPTYADMIFNYLSFVHSSNQCIAFPLQSHMWLHKQEQTTRHSRDTWRYICCCFLPWGHQCHHCAAYCGRWEDCLLPWKSSRDVLSPGLCICSSKPNLSKKKFSIMI